MQHTSTMGVPATFQWTDAHADGFPAAFHSTTGSWSGMLVGILVSLRIIVSCCANVTCVVGSPERVHSVDSESRRRVERVVKLRYMLGHLWRWDSGTNTTMHQPFTNLRWLVLPRQQSIVSSVFYHSVLRSVEERGRVCISVVCSPFTQ